ncbi:unnamed protein product [Merluccius merluccius]
MVACRLFGRGGSRAERERSSSSSISISSPGCVRDGGAAALKMSRATRQLPLSSAAQRLEANMAAGGATAEQRSDAAAAE